MPQLRFLQDQAAKGMTLAYQGFSAATLKQVSHQCFLFLTGRTRDRPSLRANRRHPLLIPDRHWRRKLMSRAPALASMNGGSHHDIA
jgi:hypothetical protein